MKKANKFYKWFKSIGGNVSNLNISDIVNTLNQVDVKVSSFKHRAQEIKDKYNYKFVNLSEVLTKTNN